MPSRNTQHSRMRTSVIKEIQIENFKSIKKLKLALGRVNVFIGENGSGKSNVLEAIALAGAAASNKLDNEFLASRGIRAPEARHMRCALSETNSDSSIVVSATSTAGQRVRYELSNDNEPYSSWRCVQKIDPDEAELKRELAELFENFFIEAKLPSAEKISSKARRGAANSAANWILEKQNSELRSKFLEDFYLSRTKYQKDSTGSKKLTNPEGLNDFIIYSPENSSLRIFQREGQIEPLGIQGEGLLKFLQVLDSKIEYKDALKTIREKLSVLDWFGGLRVPAADSSAPSKIEICDKYLCENSGSLDQISANEGFLFLLFYFCLFSTPLTPKFFAIDNVDASLNPKLCAHLVSELASLALKNDKQAILTTHNPATLDGLDLNDDQQRLFVVSRGLDGETRVKRIARKEGRATSVKLSTAFIDGYLGGLPKNF